MNPQELIAQAIALLTSGQQVSAEQLLALLQQVASALGGAAPPGDTPAAPPAPQPPQPQGDAGAQPQGDAAAPQQIDVEALRTRLIADARAAADARSNLLAEAGGVLEHVDTAWTDDEIRAAVVLAVTPEAESLLAASNDSAYIRALYDAALARQRASRPTTSTILDSRGAPRDPIAELVDSAIDPWRRKPAAGGKEAV